MDYTLDPGRSKPVFLFIYEKNDQLFPIVNVFAVKRKSLSSNPFTLLIPTLDRFLLYRQIGKCKLFFQKKETIIKQNRKRLHFQSAIRFILPFPKSVLSSSLPGNTAVKSVRFAVSMKALSIFHPLSSCRQPKRTG